MSNEPARDARSILERAARFVRLSSSRQTRRARQRHNALGGSAGLQLEWLEPRTLLSASWYVSPQGTPNGNGSLASPWDLPTALGDNTSSGSPNAGVHAGDTIWVLGGTYHGSFYSYLSGTSTSPVIVRNYQNQRATIDHTTGTGLSAVSGGNVWFWGLEITCSTTVRITSQSGSSPTDIFTGDGATSQAPPGVKFINSIVHESSGGLTVWNPGLNDELNGNLVYYVGWNAPDRTHGQGIYSQNSGGQKKIVNNIVFYNANHGMQIYGSGTAYIDNYDIENNTIFQNGQLFGSVTGGDFLLGGGHGAGSETVAGNHLYITPAAMAVAVSDFYLGYGSNGMHDSVVQNNYVAGPTYLSGTFTNVNISGNTFYGAATSSPASNVQALYPSNTYLTSRPTVGKVFVTPSQYETGRANVTIYNWGNANTVSVDVSNIGLAVGDAYEIHNAEDYYGDIIRGTYQGGSIAIPMAGHTMATPVGMAAPASTFPEFGAFVVSKSGAPASGVPAAPTGLGAAPGDGQATLTWTASAGATSYNIFRSTSSGGETQIASNVNYTMFTNTGLSNRTTYFYQVSAVNSLGQSGKSSEISVTPQSPPPTGLTGVPGAGQVVLNWTSLAGATSYDVYRSTTSGTDVQVASGISGTTFTDTGRNNGTVYFYQVSGVTSGGESGKSIEISAMPLAIGSGPLLAINAGGQAIGSFVADTDFVLGGPDSVGNTISTTGVFNPAPQAVYQTLRYGDFSYVLPNLTPGGAYAVRLDFAEDFATAAGQRVMNVLINGTQVLTNFDIFVTAGGEFKALTEQFNAVADGAGKITVQFKTVYGYARVNGIELFASSGPTVPTIPAAPTNLTAQPGNGQVVLNWTASTGATSYSIYRSMASGGETLLTSNVGGTTFTNSGLANSTKYYYQVTAVNSAGQSGKSNETFATPTANVSSALLSINAGGGAAGSFVADTDFVGGGVDNVGNAIDTSGLTNPAPQSVYQTVRYGDFSYVLPGLTPGAAYNVRLHFAEDFVSAAGQRVMNVLINGAQVLTNYDIFAAAGGKFKAIAPTFSATADGAGKITVQFKTVTGYARVSGIEVFSSSGVTVPAAPTGLTAQAGSGQVVLNWTASAGATSYTIYRSTASGAETPLPGSASGTSFTDMGLTNGTKYYYQVVAVNSAGPSGRSAEVFATPQAAVSSALLSINAGGGASGSYVADTDSVGGGVDNVGNAIDTSGVTNPAPQSVYQTVRYGDFSYVLPGLAAGAAYTVRLHFAEDFVSAAGQRVMNVLINGAQVLTNYDVFAVAGGQFKAIASAFNAAADSAGKITVQFKTVTGYARVNGIELFSGSSAAAPAAVKAASAVPASSIAVPAPAAAQIPSAAVAPIATAASAPAPTLAGGSEPLVAQPLSAPASIAQPAAAQVQAAVAVVHSLASGDTLASDAANDLEGLLDPLAADIHSARRSVRI